MEESGLPCRLAGPLNSGQSDILELLRLGHEKLGPIGRPVACPEFPRKKSYRSQTTMLGRPQWDFSQ